jgi:hypothetical protein
MGQYVRPRAGGEVWRRQKMRANLMNYLITFKCDRDLSLLGLVSSIAESLTLVSI